MDDIIIVLTDPLRSLPPLCQIISHFSMYKLNHSKSSMIGISLSPSIKMDIYKISPFSWSPPSTLTYLGIQLVSPSTMLLHMYLSSLLQKLQTISSSMMSIKTPWAGRIALARMFLLPHVLYFFRTLPLRLLPADLAKIQQILNSFILAAHRP